MVLQKELLSIIIPVYNTGQYLERCLNSVMTQTYSNIEIVLVNDGSTDCSGEICDEYMKKDVRIRVVHQNNKGLAEARNAGLNMARGGIVGFVDSDDFIEADYYEQMMSQMAKEVDIVICGKYGVFSNIKEKNIRKYSKWDSLKALARDEIGNFVWNKIFRKKLFENISFPENKKYEDILTVYKLFLKANSIVWVEGSNYYYENRSGSISRSMNSKFDEFRARYQRYECMCAMEQLELVPSGLSDIFFVNTANCAYHVLVAVLKHGIKHEAIGFIKTVWLNNKILIERISFKFWVKARIIDALMLFDKIVRINDK